MTSPTPINYVVLLEELRIAREEEEASRIHYKHCECSECSSNRKKLNDLLRSQFETYLAAMEHETRYDVGWRDCEALHRSRTLSAEHESDVLRVRLTAAEVKLSQFSDASAGVRGITAMARDIEHYIECHEDGRAEFMRKMANAILLLDAPNWTSDLAEDAGPVKDGA